MKAYISQACSLFICLALLLGGCTSPTKSSPTITIEPLLPTKTPTTMAYQNTSIPVSTQTQTAAPSLTTTPAPSETPTYTLIPTKTCTPPPPTWTPLPTLSAEDANNLLNDLLENNAGCRLPCFWGIIPGKTTWQEAQNFLETFTTFSVRDISRELRIIEPLIPFPREKLGTIRHFYSFREGIVEYIVVYNGDLASSFYLPEFLKTYGKPGGVWIRTFREEEQNSQLFLLDLFYPDLGILMEYSGGNMQDLGDRLRNCLEGMNSPFIYLWSPERVMTFEEAKKIFLDTENLPQPIALPDATGMDIDAFYDSFMNSGTVCIETPKELWP